MKRIFIVLLTLLVLLCGCMTASDLPPLEPSVEEVSQPIAEEKQATYQFSVAFNGNSYSKKVYQAAANIEKRNKCFNKAGFELLVQESSGYRLLTSASSITSLEQLKGLRIRTLDNRFHVRLWELLGAKPYQNIEWNDLYYALQEGVVEAQDNPLEIIRMGRLQNIHPYALNGPFFVTYNSLAMNKKAYDLLPVDYQKIIKEELYTAMAENTTRMRKNPIEVYGLTINSLSKDDQELLKTLLLPMLNEIEKEAGSDLTQALIAENQLKS